MKNNSLGTKILMTAVTLALLAYFGLQTYRYFADPFTTTLAYSYQVEKSVSLSGYVVRQEQVLPDEGSGLLRLRREEGERVSRGGAVASVYADQSSLDRQTEIGALEARIEQLQYAQDAAVSSELSRKLDSQIMQNILEYRKCLAEDRLAKAETCGGQLRALVLKRDYNYSENEDYSGQIQELQSRLKELKNQAAGSVQTITAPASGLYSAVVDGYETVLTPESLSDMTPSQLSAVRADSTVSSGVGKLILGDSWYYAASMSAADAEELQEASDALKKAGKSLTLRFAKSVERDLPVTVSRIGPEENGRCVVVFEGKTYLSRLTLLRQQSAQVVWDSTEGIRVPKEALRMEKVTVNSEGQRVTEEATGVYCVVGMEARFKPVEVVYNGSSFLLVRSAAPEDRENLRLRPGDEVIITANGLYDGKVVGQKG